ncbi:MAG: ParB/RepB/Spo0J family partition protein [Rhodospirillales bacterium]
MAEKKRSNLGRGLSALLGDDAGAETAAVAKGRGPRQVPVELLHPGRYQPRHSIDEERIEELAQSVRENGIIQPLLVRRHPEQKDAFEIVAGERRWRAAQMAKLHEIPVVVKDLNDQESLEIALVENLQRQDLSPLEEADGYQRLVDEFAHTQDVLAKTVGKSRSHVANMMRLLGLPEAVKKMLDGNDLTAGHARALLGAPDPVDVARQVVKKSLNVRQTERLVKKQQRRKDAPSAPAKKDIDTQALERDLGNLLGLKVAIKFKDGGGSLTVNYGSLEQLDDILHRLSQGGAAGPATDAPAAKKTATPKRAERKKRPKLSVGMRTMKAKRKSG